MLVIVRFFFDFPPQININVIDENDHAPTFFAPQYTATIREDVSVGTSVLTGK